MNTIEVILVQNKERMAAGVLQPAVSGTQDKMSVLNWKLEVWLHVNCRNTVHYTSAKVVGR